MPSRLPIGTVLESKDAAAAHGGADRAYGTARRTVANDDAASTRDDVACR